jgi:hypothetical protein
VPEAAHKVSEVLARLWFEPCHLWDGHGLAWRRGNRGRCWC